MHKTIIGLLSFLVLLSSAGVRADETCMSPYMAKIVGQEDYVYIWTLGLEAWVTARTNS